MARIQTEKTQVKGGWVFDVQVIDDVSSTRHQVQLEEEFYKNLQTEATPEEVVKESFRFLLERESKESILSQFYIQEIEDYFSDFQEKIKKRL